MRVSQCLVFSVLAFAIMPSGSKAADVTEPDIVQESWECGSKIDLKPAVTARFNPNFTFLNSDKLPTFMAGEIRDPSGLKFSAVFVDSDMGWHGYAVEGQAGFFNAYVAAASSQAVLFSMISSEGPGQTYTVLSTQDGFKTINCGELPAPDTKLDTLDYMQIKTFELDEKGHGELTGIVSFSEERPSECFRAATEDGGKQWTKPSRISLCIESAFEQLTPVPEETGPLHDLRMYSAN